MIYAYLRQILDHNIAKQQRSIASFSLTKGLSVDKEVIEYSGKNHLIEAREQFELFMNSLKEGDTLIVDKLSVISSRAEELIKVINCILSHKVNLYMASSKTLFNNEASVEEIFPLLNDLREEQKAKSNQIGRPKGSRSSSKFDIYQLQIISLLKKGFNVSSIARELNVSRSSLKDYIGSRGIREVVEGSWVEINQLQKTSGVDTTLLICPFEQDK